MLKPASPWDMLPFEFNQPIERYRRYHTLDLDTFAIWLDCLPDAYMGIVAGDPVAPEVRQLIARRLRVPPWLINECLPPTTPEQLAQIKTAYAATVRLGYGFALNAETGEPQRVAWEPASPLQHEPVAYPPSYLRRADALRQLESVHAVEPDQDYPRLRNAIEQRIRELLRLAPEARFDFDAWACEVLAIPVERWPRRNV